MRITVISLSLISALAGSPANSDTMYEVGKEACNAVLQGQEATFGEKYYRRFADLVDLGHEELCECVGIEFTLNAEDQASLMEAAGSTGEAQALIEITKHNLDSCLPDFDELEPAIQGMIMRGVPEGSHEMAEAQDASSGADGADREADERLCRAISRGDVESEYLDTDYLSQWEKQSELHVIDMCGGCVVEAMQDRRRDLATEGGSLETLNDVSHRNAVGGAMTECMHHTFKLPLN